MKVTTQRTSKPLKLMLLLSSLMIIISILMLIGAPSATGFTLLLVGLAGHVLSRVLIWWNHD
ncbi:hypothetical protein C9E85_00745 [Plesiomonas shigelloides]|uniref:hypothetical protein n=1 Tax=Plesiomonas shigelloides TaxID=703 RepID=UPI000D580374|nr:hypothetical protein [Plesiomonas shigelloides]MCX2533886.1 hypothetical protein [Plesiomonas shigelloides]PVU67737.1 hypothetical protein C9E85_00745 [Plesiomonas shigelloides]